MPPARRPRTNPQAVAARVLTEVTARGRFLDAALEQALAALPAPLRATGGLIQELCYGGLRHWHRLAAMLGAYLARPLKDKDRDVFALLLLGLYQLRETRAPQAVTVAETVEATQHLGKPWAKALVNACLREYLRDPARGEQAAARDPQAAFSHPRWLLEALQQAWPQHWRAIVDANNARPPLTLRVNRRVTSRERYLARLAEAGIDAAAADCTEAGVVLAQPLPVERLPGFSDGAVSVQDAAAQLVAQWLDARAGERVLDACAAPGGKSAHILERTPALAELVAVDNDPGRVRRIADNLARLRLSARLLAADATRPQDWWDGAMFDRVLLDVPCSTTGVIRRHPDIKLRRQPGDLARLTGTQRQLLRALWPLLRPGGKLLYVTCSILPDENERQIADFLADHRDAAELPLGPGRGLARAHGRQCLPGDACGDASLDGFYYCALGKH